jgi:hypothetical protein
MSHFAKVENGIVTQVIVAERDVLDTGFFGNPVAWVQTSYNTRAGVHYGTDGQPDGGTPLRKNYAGIGYVYDSGRDAFYLPQPYASWTLDEDTCVWQPPVPYPIDGVSSFTQTTFPEEGLKVYEWDESIVNWKEVSVVSSAEFFGTNNDTISSASNDTITLTGTAS